MNEICANQDFDLKAPIVVGGITVPNRVFLAPMSGVTDLPFRRLASRFGAGLVVSEMVASEALITGQDEMQAKMDGDDIPIHVVQLAGREAKWMALAAAKAEAAGAQIIDINMGCPARKVTNGYSGSALMRDIDHALELVEATVDAVDVPVTLKMRLGWDENSINAPELAKRAVEAGVQMITVHGRTRNQFYKGQADWLKIAAVRDTIDVPLVVNGDIENGVTAHQALSACGADAVMVGRASYGAPWLAGQIARGVTAQPPVGLAEIVLEHHEAMLSFYGSELGGRQARKHLGWYIDHLPQPPEVLQKRREMLTNDNPVAVQHLIEQVFMTSDWQSAPKAA